MRKAMTFFSNLLVDFDQSMEIYGSKRILTLVK
jgi:hypothetical protein